MTGSNMERTQMAYARLAGFLYLFIIAVFVLGDSITDRIEVPGNFAETARRIMASEMLYRVGLSMSLILAMSIVLLTIGLYVVLKPVNSNLALLGLAFRFVEAICHGVETAIGFVILHLYIGADLKDGLDAKQLSALVNLYSAEYLLVFHVGLIFFCVGSFLFYFLFFKSNYIPRILSGLGLVACVLVCMLGVLNLIAPQYVAMLLPLRLSMALAQVSVGLWLLIKGVKVRPQES